MLFPAQVPGANELVTTAASHGWEAAAIAVVLLTMIASVGWLMKSLWAINQRLADRVTNLESKIEDRLMGLVEATTAVVTSNTEMLRRTARAIEKLELAVERSQNAQATILARIETSPCLITEAFSPETVQRIQQAREAAKKAANDALRDPPSS